MLIASRSPSGDSDTEVLQRVSFKQHYTGLYSIWEQFILAYNNFTGCEFIRNSEGYKSLSLTWSLICYVVCLFKN